LIPKIGPVKDSGTLLAPLTDKNPVPKEVIQTKDGFFVVRLLATEPADQNKFVTAQKAIEKRLTSQKQEEYFLGWLNQLKSKAKIEINPDVLKM
jgi:peptidyl-prolyl cis-trans isomerase D